jgi:hypothetical protein
MVDSPISYKKPDDFVNVFQGAQLASTKALGAMAKEEAVDGMTKSEEQSLETLANFALNDPRLPAPDKDALLKFITLLQSYHTVDTPPGVLFANFPPAKNPWMTASYLIALALVLSQFEGIQDKMIRASSIMKQAMIELTVAMAKESYTFSISATEARAKTLETDMWSHIGMAIASGIQIAATVANYAYSSKQYGELSEQRQKQLTAVDSAKEDDGVTDRSDAWKQAQRQSIRDDFHQQRQELSQTDQMRTSVIGQVGSILQSVVTAVTDSFKKTLTVAEGAAQAVKEQIDKLVQIITQTTQSAQEIQDGITKEVRDFAEKVSNLASTVAQSFWRG